MSDAALRLLGFINQVRAEHWLNPLRNLGTLGADPDDERECILAQAMECAVGESDDPVWAGEGRWVMRFESLRTAAAVARMTGQDWVPERLEFSSRTS